MKLRWSVSRVGPRGAPGGTSRDVGRALVAVVILGALGMMAGATSAGFGIVGLPSGAAPRDLGPLDPPGSASAPVQVADRLLPRPQYVQDKAFSLALGQEWTIVLDTQDDDFAFAGQWFNQKLATDQPLSLRVVDFRDGYARGRQILIGSPNQPHVAEALLRRRRLMPPVGEEGYLLEVFGEGRPEILIAAPRAAGAFYGVVTLLQLIGSDARLPGVRIVDYPEHGLRGSYEPTSIRLEWRDGKYHFTEANQSFIDWLASRKFNTVFTVENGAFFREEDAWLDAYQALFTYARRRFIEPVPRLCSISSVGPFDFEFFEGWYVQDEPFTIDSSGVAVPQMPPVDLVPNGDFELDRDGDGIPDGWTVTSKPGATWSLDSSVAFSGSRSMRLEIPTPAPESSRAVLRLTVSDVVPNSHYCLWAKALARDIVDVRPQLTIYARDSAGKVLVLQSDVTWSTTRWRDFGSCIRTPADAETISFYSRIQYPGTGTFWLDDVHLYRVDGALRNVIRANDTDIRVTDASGTVSYELGRDYEVEDGETSVRFRPELRPFVVRRLPGGNLQPGQEVRLSYDAYFFYRGSQYWSSAPCVARDELYTRYYEPAIDRLVKHLQPEYINIDADEIRGFYRDSRMRAAFSSNAEAIAYWANRVQAILAARSPQTRLWIWDDMVSPYHNGGVADYQVRYGGLPGRMAEATEREWIDKSIIMDVWWYGDSRLSQMWHSIKYFGQKGYDVLGSPWLAADNITSWSEMLLGQEHALGGVETNWGTPFEASHEQFADHFWNTRYSLRLFDSFEEDADRDGVPDGWRVQGVIDYSTDGTRNHGARYADFPNAAVGIVTDTLGFQSELIPVRPATEYVLSVFAMADEEGGPAPRLTLEWVDAQGHGLGETGAPMVGLTSEYRLFELQARSPTGAAFASVRLDEAVPGVWYDVVRLKEETRYFGLAGPAVLAEARLGQPYHETLVVDGGVAPLSWSVSAGRLPGGLSLQADGTITGVAEEGGSFPVTVHVTDAAGLAAEQSYVLEVTGGLGRQVYVPFAQRD